MQDSEFRYLDESKIKEMLFHNDEYISEFASATEESFNEFAENYEKYLLDKNEKEFRRAGHKIKPVAQMIGADQIVEEYEHGKTLIWDDKGRDELIDSIDRIKDMCRDINSELNNL